MKSHLEVVSGVRQSSQSGIHSVTMCWSYNWLLTHCSQCTGHFQISLRLSLGFTCNGTKAMRCERCEMRWPFFVCFVSDITFWYANMNDIWKQLRFDATKSRKVHGLFQRYRFVGEVWSKVLMVLFGQHQTGQAALVTDWRSLSIDESFVATPWSNLVRRLKKNKANPFRVLSVQSKLSILLTEKAKSVIITPPFQLLVSISPRAKWWCWVLLPFSPSTLMTCTLTAYLTNTQP